MDILVNLKLSQGPWVGFYEELLSMRDFLPRLSDMKIIIVENNLLAPRSPCLLEQDQVLEFFDYQQEEYEPNTPLLKVLARYYGDVKILDEKSSLILPVSLDEEIGERISFWKQRSEAIDANSDSSIIELGSKEDWTYRINVMKGKVGPARFLYHGSQIPTHATGLMTAMSELEIPCSLGGADSVQERMEYDANQFLPLLRKYWGKTLNFVRYYFIKTQIVLLIQK